MTGQAREEEGVSVVTKGVIIMRSIISVYRNKDCQRLTKAISSYLQYYTISMVMENIIRCISGCYV